MKLEQSPFPAAWWGTSLDNVGLKDQRPNVGTYGRYEYENLPPLPVKLNADFSWLKDARVHAHHIGLERNTEIFENFQRLQKLCNETGVVLPGSFQKFIQSTNLHSHIRSNTDCFLDLAKAPVASPVGNGVLIRFLSDSQGCIFWYLYISKDMEDHAVVSSPDYYDIEFQEWDDEEKPNPDELVFNDQSFEAFICRFWLENELWFSEYDGTPISDLGRKYLEDYQRSLSSNIKNG